MRSSHFVFSRSIDTFNVSYNFPLLLSEVLLDRVWTRCDSITF